MFSIIGLLLLASGVISSEFYLLDQDYYDLGQAEETFQQFVTKYNKKYTERSDYRFQVFTENLKKYNEWNKKSGSNIFGVNKYTDMTFVEFSKCKLGFNAKYSKDNAIDFKPSGVKAPESLDWRRYGYVTSVKDQQECGACFAFSAIGNIEGQYAKIHKTKAISLSNQQALDCSSESNCKNGGSPHQVFQSLAQQGGAMLESDYPYEDSKRQCRTDRSKIAARVIGGGILNVGGESGLKEALASYGPLSIGICVNEEVVGLRNTIEGVFYPINPCVEENHAVLLVGYGNVGGHDYWLIKNSWGENWGEAGYMRLVRGQGALTIGNYTAISVVA